jgi:hypothetical protein
MPKGARIGQFLDSLQPFKGSDDNDGDSSTASVKEKPSSKKVSHKPAISSKPSFLQKDHNSDNNPLSHTRSLDDSGITTHLSDDLTTSPCFVPVDVEQQKKKEERFKHHLATVSRSSIRSKSKDAVSGRLPLSTANEMMSDRLERQQQSSSGVPSFGLIDSKLPVSAFLRQKSDLTHTRMPEGIMIDPTTGDFILGAGSGPATLWDLPPPDSGKSKKDSKKDKKKEKLSSKLSKLKGGKDRTFLPMRSAPLPPSGGFFFDSDSSIPTGIPISMSNDQIVNELVHYEGHEGIDLPSPPAAFASSQKSSKKKKGKD